MKKLFLLCLALWSLNCFASNNIVYVDANGNIHDQNWLNTYSFTPCQNAKFQVNVDIPSGYKICSVDWYDAAFNTYQVTTTNVVTIPITKDLQVVACTVNLGSISGNCSTTTQQPISGVTLHMVTIGLTTPATSSTFNLGCTTPGSFSSSIINDGHHYVPANGTYSLTWNLPSGWTNTPNNLTTTVTPNALSAGNVSLSLTLNACPYTATSANYNIVRTKPAPTFAASNTYNICSASSKTFAINAVCGASNYTYTLTGNSNPKFSNGLQTITTSSTSISVTVTTVGYQATLSVKANFPNSTSSAITSKTIYVGAAQQISLTKQQGSCSSGGTYQTWLLSAGPTSYGTNWNWSNYDPSNYKYIYSPNSSSTYVDLYANGGTVLLTYTDVCGTTQSVPAGIYKYCPPNFAITPNPSKNYIAISEKNSSSVATGKIKAIKITDRMGTVRKTYEYKSFINSVKVTVSDLESGVYLISIYDGYKWNTQSLMIQ